MAKILVKRSKVYGARSKYRGGRAGVVALLRHSRRLSTNGCRGIRVVVHKSKPVEIQKKTSAYDLIINHEDIGLKSAIANLKSIK